MGPDIALFAFAGVAAGIVIFVAVMDHLQRR
jgi:hypothetical protein